MPEFQIAKILTLFTLAFIFAILWTPILTHYLYKYKMGKNIRNSGKTPIFSKLHAHKAGTPTMGGILIWLTLLILIILLCLSSTYTTYSISLICYTTTLK
jgi:phospho-N-acetylmuramoyl-pentapeptide-transferase